MLSLFSRLCAQRHFKQHNFVLPILLASMAVVTIASPPALHAQSDATANTRDATANTRDATANTRDAAANTRDVQRRVVKVYGAGGMRGLEAYQSGFLVSPEGHVATAWSYVLDVEPIVVLDDGRRFESEIVGIEPALELAVLKIDASDLPYFAVDKELSAQWGDPILAVSNLFGIAAGNEPASVMQGIVAGITNLDARRGTFKTPYRGKVMILDLIANNPGAAGGAVVDADGKLIGMLGKELRDSGTGVWLNYALPIDALRKAIGDIIAGRATTTPKEDNPILKRGPVSQPDNTRTGTGSERPRVDSGLCRRGRSMIRRRPKPSSAPTT